MYQLWRRFQSLFDRNSTKHFLSSTLQYCRNGKPMNVLKSVNTENKYLYGRLLETQKQRRRTNRGQKQIESETEKVSEDDDTDKKDDLNNISHGDTANDNCIMVKKKKSSSSRQSYKNNNDEMLCELSLSSLSNVEAKNSKRSIGRTLTNEIEINNHKNVEAPIDKNNLEQNTPAKIVKKRKIKAPNNVPNPSCPTGKVEDCKILTEIEQSPRIFSISSHQLQINEINFPLESKEKASAIDSKIPSPASFGFKDPEVKSYATFPSVSKIIEETMSSKNRQILNKWKENMIKELGEAGFHEHNLVVKERGARFHNAVREALLGRATQDDDLSTKDAMRSLAWLMQHISSPLAVESITAHPALRYRGIPDCVAMFRNVPVVVDWKLSDKPKKDLKDTYDAPVQITAYMGALNHDPNYAWMVNHGLVAVAYTSGEPADVFLLSPEHCRIYWRHWLMRMEKFNSRSNLHVEHNIDERDLLLD